MRPSGVAVPTHGRCVILNGMCHPANWLLQLRKEVSSTGSAYVKDCAAHSMH
jgi:hypothetical protein